MKMRVGRLYKAVQTSLYSEEFCRLVLIKVTEVDIENDFIRGHTLSIWEDGAIRFREQDIWFPRTWERMGYTEALQREWNFWKAQSTPECLLK